MKIAQLVQDHEVELGQAFSDLPGLSLGLFLLECIDQLDGREEADLPALMLYGLNAEGRCDMGFAGAGPPPLGTLLRNALPGSGAGPRSERRP